MGLGIDGSLGTVQMYRKGCWVVYLEARLLEAANQQVSEAPPKCSTHPVRGSVPWRTNYQRWSDWSAKAVACIATSEPRIHAHYNCIQHCGYHFIKKNQGTPHVGDNQPEFSCCTESTNHLVQADPLGWGDLHHNNIEQRIPPLYLPCAQLGPANA